MEADPRLTTVACSGLYCGGCPLFQATRDGTLEAEATRGVGALRLLRAEGLEAWRRVQERRFTCGACGASLSNRDAACPRRGRAVPALA